MSHVKKQHYVPQFLLKNFTNEKGLVWFYDKRLRKVQEKGVGGVAYEEYFYDKGPGQKEGSFEYIFQRAETDAAPVIQKIIETKNLAGLSLDEKVTMGLFTALQLQRTKTAVSEQEYLNKQFMDGISSWMKEVNPEIEIGKTPVRDLWFSSFEYTHEFGTILVNKSWMLFESNEKFYCSDHPVVKQNIAQKDKAEYRGVLGLNSDGIEIYFSLTPSLILGICCERTYSQFENFRFQCDSGNVENFNSLQVRYADRFIFAKSNYFELVEDMYTKGHVM